ncbi:MAG: beta-ketoacyl-[acyl-carrier-protein] synthase family protein [Desulfuromonadaceae bacterium]|nr:beta-ketoacyl-[acyl-carrier-protein] synthase family protein [Desulfuromonadaceae bacterium]
MNEVVICAAAAVTALGDTLDQTWERLLKGECGIRPVTRFDTSGYAAAAAACVADLLPAANGSRLPILLERLLDGFGTVPVECMLLTASTKGEIDLLERFRRGEVIDRQKLLPETFLHHLRRMTGLRGEVVNIQAACASSTLALGRGAGIIAHGLADAVLVVCCDLVSEFVFSGFSALQALSPGSCRPFDRHRDGLSLGEGAAALLLMNRNRAVREKRPVLARLLGWGAANDANHITAPARDGGGLILAVKRALERSGISPGEVAGISAHGTGTVFNDLMELTAFRTLFGERKLPLHSVKGATGHTLGAAGGIEAALAVRSLESGLLPPTVGLQNAEPGAEGCVDNQALPFSGKVLLSTNSGFGGINGALILGREDWR